MGGRGGRGCECRWGGGEGGDVSAEGGEGREGM